MKCGPRQALGTLALAAASIAGPGCMAINPKPIALAPECMAACGDVPCACRGKVYVFLLSGFDPLDLDRVGDFRAALVRAGFTKVYNGQFYHDRYFAQEMRRLAAEEPDSRFVVVGFSLGTEFAVSLAESVGHQGIPISLLASVDPYWWSGAPSKTPANVQQTMNLHGEPLLFANRAGSGAEVQIPESFPNNITAHPLTVETLARALANVAGTVTPPPPSSPAPQLADDVPTPRPVSRTSSPRDEWDFLKPTASLRGLSPIDSSVPITNPGERTSLRPAPPAVVN
jgi:pimeloyl-ACP methyl ester carboxylesterase